MKTMSSSVHDLHNTHNLLFLSAGPGIPFVAVYKTQRDAESETQDRESEYLNQHKSESCWTSRGDLVLGSVMPASEVTLSEGSAVFALFVYKPSLEWRQ